MKRAKRTILMDMKKFKLAARLARFGRGNKIIQAKTGLTDSQITYRCATYKQVTGMPKGLRRTWSSSDDPVIDQIIEDLGAVFDAEFEHQFLPKIVHPTPQMVKIKEPKPPTVKDMERQLRRVNRVKINV